MGALLLNVVLMFQMNEREGKREGDVSRREREREWEKEAEADTEREEKREKRTRDENGIKYHLKPASFLSWAIFPSIFHLVTYHRNLIEACKRFNRKHMNVFLLKWK